MREECKGISLYNFSRTKSQEMYIAQKSFTSVHGRYYYRGQEINWLRFQLMAKTDKRNFVSRNMYVSSYEEDYRRELQERDEDMRVYSGRTIPYDPTQYPGNHDDGWRPDEDIMHFSSLPPTHLPGEEVDPDALLDSIPATDPVIDNESIYGPMEEGDPAIPPPGVDSTHFPSIEPVEDKQSYDIPEPIVSDSAYDVGSSDNTTDYGSGDGNSDSSSSSSMGD